ncbi:exonuclease SbcCD subunit D [Schumannella luteola]|uniref:Nuclease SbcCD subunit D n=1 Tax=Schumannella luteola TaxID=472059 RepID=A0A852YHR1_9MICO|nr:exonuclease SbcCD subunit D [Schumannella luteola]NYG98618.1 exonuclease SbcD [Schumannella luteola]TPX02591.1 exonuclease SbcCD subunit D [Schumannella luteola]
MKLLHTSDWHIGRTFHGHSTLEALRAVLAEIPVIVGERGVDAVLVAGDVFDSAAPSADAFRLLSDAVRAIREAGATVIMTSGNHDSAARLGFQAEYAALGGVHILTDPATIAAPVTLSDEHGKLDVYGIPYLEPVLVRHGWGRPELRTQAQVLDVAMERVRAAIAERAAAAAAAGEGTAVRTVVLAHTFASGGAAEAEASDVEREIRVGGVDAVPLGAFDGVDYAALGHIHGRAQLAEHIRYSGAPLHYSFSEAAKVRGGWLVELDADGLAAVEWVDLPVPRALAVLRGTLEELLSSPSFADAEQRWVSAVLTDQARPSEAMRRLQSRFPWCAQLGHEPAGGTAADGAASYAERVQGRSDEELVAGFLAHVRNGVGASAAEEDLVRELVAEVRGEEAAA